MTEAVIVALITAGCALLGQALLARKSNQELYARLDKQSELKDQELDGKLEKWRAVTDTRLEELTREVRRHNDFAERIPVIEERIKVANNRIKVLEEHEK